MRGTVDDGGLIAQAAALAGATVAIVQHSGRRGTHQEFAALAQGLEQAMEQFPNNPYVQVLLTAETRQQIDGFASEYEDVPKQTTVNDFKMAALNRCAQAAEWLAAHASRAEAAEVKQCILAVCRSVAAESKEQGPLNVSTENVDPFEQSVIEEITRALDAA
jgi:hypothetical protein